MTFADHLAVSPELAAAFAEFRAAVRARASLPNGPRRTPAEVAAVFAEMRRTSDAFHGLLRTLGAADAYFRTLEKAA